MPEIGCGFSAVFSSRTVPEYQKPPRSAWTATVVLVLRAGAIGEAGTLPSQLQVPAKNLIWASSGAGRGGAAGWARPMETAPTRTRVRGSIERSCLSPQASAVARDQ